MQNIIIRKIEFPTDVIILISVNKGWRSVRYWDLQDNYDLTTIKFKIDIKVESYVPNFGKDLFIGNWIDLCVHNKWEIDREKLNNEQHCKFYAKVKK